MISLVKLLCSALKCDIDDLPQSIRDNPSKALSAIEKLQIYATQPDSVATSSSSFEQPSSSKLSPVKCDGLTKAGVSTLFACGGFLGITVEQFYYVRHNRLFSHPQLQCIIQRQGDYGGEIYIPIEVILVDNSRK